MRSPAVVTTLFFAALAATRVGTADALDLPIARLPDDHPCRLPDDRFHLLEEKDGIVIRTSAQSDGTTVVRSEVEIAATAPTVADLLADIEGWSRWLKRLESAKRVDGEPPAFHLVVRAPWPFSDRDYGILPALDRVDPDSGGRLPRWAIRESYRRGPIGILGSLRRVLSSRGAAARSLPRRRSEKRFEREPS